MHFEFEWDGKKNASNLEKHNLSFYKAKKHSMTQIDLLLKMKNTVDMKRGFFVLVKLTD